MNKLLLLIFFFIIAVQIGYSQEERMVCGRLIDKSDGPLIGVGIYLKGTNIGTISDLNGNYCIKAPLGSTLIFSYVGFTSFEVLVTKLNSQPITTFTSKNGNVEIKSSNTPICPSKTFTKDTLSNMDGVAYFTSETPSYEVVNPNSNWFNSNKTDVRKIRNINYGFNKTKISLIKDEFLKLPHITFISSFSIEKYTKISELQNEYAQGRPINGNVQWQGPDLAEIFSWGPAIKNLEYDGSTYEFDKNGRIVIKGFGNGTKVNSYNPLKFFKTGTNLYNYIKIHGKYEKREYSITASNKNTHGIIPKAYKNGNYFDAYFIYKFKRAKLSSRFTYDDSRSSLMSGNTTLNLIMASVLTTPPTFDNSNNFSAGDASKHKESYLQLNQSQRSFAPGLVNNPYWLVNNLTDKENLAVTSFSFGADFEISKKIHSFLNGNLQNQENKINLIYPENTAGVDRTRELNRTDKLTSYTLTTGLKFDYQNYNTLSINSQFTYSYKYTKRSLFRNDYFLANETSYTFTNSPNSVQHNMGWDTNFTLFRGFLGKISQNIFTSNLYNKNLLYSPSLSAGINFIEFLEYNHVIDFLKLRGNWGITYSDIPLAYAFGNFNMQNMQSTRYSESFFSYETIPNFSLSPEKIVKKGLGLDFTAFRNKIDLSLDAYQNKTFRGIFPVMDSNSTVLKNLADYKTWGMDANVNFYFNSYHSRIRYNFQFIFSKYKNVVTHIENNLSEVSLAGFSDVHTALIKGQAKGVIVGTTYKYNENGDMVIGNDGFPLVDDGLHVVGDPNPDYSIGFESNISYKNLSFSILMEFRKGGEVWNGTENALAYLGLAKKTINERNVTGFLFPGVKADGTKNTTPVDFANPSNSLDVNRWYRYGSIGVAEDAIQDATFFRIREITMNYSFRRHNIYYSFSLFVRNPMLITKYAGVDPESTLWGKASTMGMDLFNFPGTTSMGINFKLSI